MANNEAFDETDEIATDDYEAALATFGSLSDAMPAAAANQAQNTAETPAEEPLDIPNEKDIEILREELGSTSAKVLDRLVKALSKVAEQTSGSKSIMQQIQELQPVMPHIRRVGQNAAQEYERDMHNAFDRIAEMGGASIVGANKAERIANFEKLRPGMGKIIAAAEKVWTATNGSKSVWDIAADIWERNNPTLASRARQTQAVEQGTNQARRMFAESANRAAVRAQPTQRHTAGPRTSRIGNDGRRSAMDVIDAFVKARGA